jgi:DNA invertase Pin-like site-specific DNA recombinase
MAGKLVAYFRVSTQRQGNSGLGLEAQRAAVHDYARRSGAVIVKEFTEMESGKRSDRPELAKALAHARRSQALLCVAKIDRLSRNVAFLSALMDSGVDFVACDNPTANRLTIHILIAVAEDEARRISERTKAALAALIERGVKLGNPINLTAAHAEKGRRIAAKARRKYADEAYADLYPILTEQRAAGLSLQAIADYLNGQGYVTRQGKQWNKVQVRNVLNRAARLEGSGR